MLVLPRILSAYIIGGGVTGGGGAHVYIFGAGAIGGACAPV